jgi:hypothetical protein
VRTRDDAAAALLQLRAVGADGIDRAEVADGDVDPAVDAEANAVGRVIGARAFDGRGCTAR